MNKETYFGAHLNISPAILSTKSDTTSICPPPESNLHANLSAAGLATTFLDYHFGERQLHHEALSFASERLPTCRVRPRPRKMSTRKLNPLEQEIHQTALASGDKVRTESYLRQTPLADRVNCRHCHRGTLTLSYPIRQNVQQPSISYSEQAF